MSSLARVPCTIVTGFLGSGKTTLIRHVLENANGRRLAVIVNEFGDVGECHPQRRSSGLARDSRGAQNGLAERQGRRTNRRRGTPPGGRLELAVGLLARGSLPSPPSRESLPVASRLGLAAYSCGGSRGIGHETLTAFPSHVPPHAGTDDDADYSRRAGISKRGKGSH